MVLLLGGDFAHAGRALIGDVLGLVTAVFYAGYQLTVTRLRAAVSTASIMAVSGTVTALILLPIAICSGRALPSRIRTRLDAAHRSRAHFAGCRAESHCLRDGALAGHVRFGGAPAASR
jgi:hypothetical protein